MLSSTSTSTGIVIITIDSMLINNINIIIFKNINIIIAIAIASTGDNVHGITIIIPVSIKYCY